MKLADYLAHRFAAIGVFAVVARIVLDGSWLARAATVVLVIGALCVWFEWTRRPT